MMYRLNLKYRRAGADITAQANGITVQRTFWLLGNNGQQVRQLKDGETLPKGSYIGSIVTANSNLGGEMRYVLVTNPKPGSCEIQPVEDRRFAQNATTYVLREDKEVGVFWHHEQTSGSLQDMCVLRAEMSGEFVVAPAMVELMYKPGNPRPQRHLPFQCEGGRGRWLRSSCMPTSNRKKALWRLRRGALSWLARKARLCTDGGLRSNGTSYPNIGGSMNQLLPILGALLLASVAMAETPARLTVENTALHDINPLLFGQFMERPAGPIPKGERGVEGLADSATGKLPPKIMAMLKDMQIPIIRFPAGTDVDWMDWRDMISNVPGRAATTAPAGRPESHGKNGTVITNRFGFDEYFAVQAELGCETILVLNLRDALMKKTPLKDAALVAAGLVAYANAPVGAKLPDGMPDWPAVRAKNGHPAPFKAKYFQIGNEAWLMAPKVMEDLKLNYDDASAWMAECYLEFAKQMRAVDPTIEIIIDGNMGKVGDKSMQLKILPDARLKALKPLMARHVYSPGNMDKIWQGPTTQPGELKPQDWWDAWVAMPGSFDDAGQCTGPANDMTLAKKEGYRVVVTEWNWAGFGMERIKPRPEVGHHLAAGIGASGFLQGLMRSGDTVVLGTQSMLVGTGWGFTAVRTSGPNDAAPYYSAQGLATNLYNKHHGKSVLKTKIENVAVHPQPYQFGWGPMPSKAVATLDLMATADEKTIYIHAINRDIKTDFPLTVTLEKFTSPLKAGTIVHTYLTGKPNVNVKPEEVRDVTWVETRKIDFAGGQTITLTLPRIRRRFLKCRAEARQGQ